MKIEVFGPGCFKCKKTYENILNTLAKSNIAADLVKIEDINEIINRGILHTPAVYIDGVQKISGQIPSETLILTWIKS